MKRWPAFSLVEIAIGLFIVGLLLTAVMKGTKLIDSAKVQTCVQQIYDIKRNFDIWREAEDNKDPASFPLKEVPKVGGKFVIQSNNGQNVLAIVDGGNNGLLSLDQVREMKRYLPDAITDCDLSTIGTGSKRCTFQASLNGGVA